MTREISSGSFENQLPAWKKAIGLCVLATIMAGCIRASADTVPVETQTVQAATWEAATWEAATEEPPIIIPAEVASAAGLLGDITAPLPEPAPGTILPVVVDQEADALIERSFQFDLPQNHILIRVEDGNTLWRFAQTFGTNVETLKNLNGIDNPQSLQVGQFLLIPTTGGVGGAESIASQIVTPEEIMSSGELLFVAAPRPDLPAEQDFNPEELRKINRFLRGAGPSFLTRLFGSPWGKGLVWIRQPFPEQWESNNFAGWVIREWIESPSGSQPVMRLYMKPFSEMEDSSSRSLILFESVLAHEMAHIWIGGGLEEISLFDHHEGLVRLADDIWKMENTRENEPMIVCTKAEHYLYFRSPTFFRDLFLLIRQRGQLELTEEEIFKISEQVMPDFREWWSAFHSSPEIPSRPTEDFKFVWNFIPSSGENLIVPWHVPVRHPRPLGLFFDFFKEGSCVSDYEAFPDENGLYWSFCEIAQLPFPEIPSNSLAVPWISSLPPDQIPSPLYVPGRVAQVYDYPFYPPISKLNPIPAGQWVLK